MEYILIVLVAVSLVLLVVVLLSLKKQGEVISNTRAQDELLSALSARLSAENRNLRLELEEKIDRLSQHQQQIATQNRESNQKYISELSNTLQGELHRFLRHSSDHIEKIRANVDEKLSGIQTSNEKKLDEMRQVVDEKLAKTLETRLKESFETVRVQLESVHSGLGEMKAVAQSVGSLSRLLSGSKSRGILGEVQLGQIIEDMLPSHLYEKEVPTVNGSKSRVEYAIKLPGTETGRHVYLPIDSKFPLDPYERLLDAYDTANPEEIETARKALFARIRVFAKDVTDKYVSPPETTNFAIIFLPTEGLYAEIARDATFFDTLRQSGVVVAGPTTLSAMLNSMQLGFKTLQLQKGAADIEKTLGAVKKEFGTFETVLTKAHQKITQAGNDIETLVGVRTRAINRSLRDVQMYTEDEVLLEVIDD